MTRVPDLEAIAYVSNAAKGLTEAQLEQLLAASRKRNSELGITGVLLFDHDLFFQYFEGSKAAVETVFQHIQRSVFHSGLYLMMREPISQRAFPDWLMGFTQVPESTILKLADASWKQTLDDVKPASTAPMGLKMLMQFWKDGLGTKRG